MKYIVSYPFTFQGGYYRHISWLSRRFSEWLQCNINPYEFWTGNNGEEEGEVGKKKSRFLYIINALFCFSFSNVPSNYFCFVLSSSSQIHSSNPFYTSCEFSPFLSFSPLVVLLANKMGRKKGRGRREERRDSSMTLWNLSVK